MTGQPLPDVVTNLTQATGVRVLPDGSILVATQSNVKRCDAAGNLIRNYSVAGVFFWLSVNLDPDGVSFWSLSGFPVTATRFNLTTGAVISKIPLDVIYAPNALAVMGEITGIGGAVASTPPKLTIAHDGTDVLLSWTQTATNYYLEQTLLLGAQANWQSNTIPPILGGGKKTVRQNINSTPRFFRLRTP